LKTLTNVKDKTPDKNTLMYHICSIVMDIDENSTDLSELVEDFVKLAKV
jgi:hypothetical protein